ncbi:hypothetical protein BGZ93_000706 [Podila epicladia]|nr:hypothetical protein BGZ92_000715 [Podila epicladia]KAG0085368.1 hypothetical protein BGZ93_000706 [Podila epicladia]
MTARDITSYNFSDRKTIETAPSAPPVPPEHPLALTSQQDMQRWLDYYAQQPSPMNAQGTSGHRAQRSDPGIGSQAGSSRAVPQQHLTPPYSESGEEADEAKETKREMDEDDVTSSDNDMIPLKSRRYSQERLSGSNARADSSLADSETRPYSEGSTQSPYQDVRTVNYNVNKPLPRILEGRTRAHQRRSYSSPEMELQGENDLRPQQRSHGKSPRRGAMGKLPLSGIQMPTSTGLSTEIAQNLMALEETIDQAFESLGDTWVQKIQRATTTPVQAAVNQATTNAVAAVNHATTNAEKAKAAATEQATTAAAMAAGVWADEKAKLVTAVGEQREKIKLVFGPWSKEL